MHRQLTMNKNQTFKNKICLVHGIPETELQLQIAPILRVTNDNEQDRSIACLVKSNFNIECAISLYFDTDFDHNTYIHSWLKGNLIEAKNNDESGGVDDGIVYSDINQQNGCMTNQLNRNHTSYHGQDKIDNFVIDKPANNSDNNNITANDRKIAIMYAINMNSQTKNLANNFDYDHDHSYNYKIDQINQINNIRSGGGDKDVAIQLAVNLFNQSKDVENNNAIVDDLTSESSSKRSYLAAGIMWLWIVGFAVSALFSLYSVMEYMVIVLPCGCLCCCCGRYWPDFRDFQREYFDNMVESVDELLNYIS